MTTEEWRFVAFFAAWAMAALALWLINHTWGRRLFWIGTSLFGMFMAALASAYLIGIPILFLAVCWGYGWRARTFVRYALAASFLGVVVGFGMAEIIRGYVQNEGPPTDDEFAGWLTWGLSGVAALASASKIGEMLGRWADRGAKQKVLS